MYLIQDNQRINIIDKFKSVHVVYEVKILNGSFIQKQQKEQFLQIQENKKLNVNIHMYQLYNITQNILI